MSRMSKADKLDWSLFLNEKGRRTYNELCRHCTHECRQSFRATIIECPHYESKRKQ